MNVLEVKEPVEVSNGMSEIDFEFLRILADDGWPEAVQIYWEAWHGLVFDPWLIENCII